MTVRSMFARSPLLIGARPALMLVLGLVGCPGDDPDTDPTDGTDDTDVALVDGRWDADTWDQLQTFAASNLTPVPAPSNAVADDADAAALGQMLFFEKAHSGPIKPEGADNGSNGGLGDECDMGKVSCESCHMANTLMLTDIRSNPPDHATTIGTGPVGRNVPGSVNAVFYDYIGLSGARDSLWGVSAFATNAAPIGSSELAVAHMVAGKYGDLYNDVFDPDLPADLDRYPAWGSPGDGGAFDGMSEADQTTISTIFANYSKALGAYQRHLELGDSDFDRYLNSEFALFSDAEKRGLELFIGDAKCTSCHSGPHFSDNGFHNIATSVGEGDSGRFAAIGALNTFRYTSAGDFSDDTTNNKIDAYPADKEPDGTLIADEGFKGQFRTQTLRGISQSGPFMHKGNLKSLEDVVNHYNTPPAPDVGTLDPAMSPLGLTSDQVDDLVAFLITLEADGVDPALLVDTSRTNADAQAAGLSGYEASASNLPAAHPCAPPR